MLTKKSSIIVLCVLFAIVGRAQDVSDGWTPSALRAGDILQINIFRAPEFDRSVRVEEDGTFAFPLCGSISAAGRTTRQVASDLQEKLASQLAAPHVDIFVTTWGPRTVYLLGEFKSGSMSMELPTYSRLTALQAISAAGGFSESADLANVAVLRRNADNSYERIPVDVSVLLGNEGTPSEIVLHPEDTLLAPRAAAVSISGRVGNPTTINIETKRPPMLSELIVRAGGLSDGADLDKIVIVRASADGTREILHASLRSDKPGEFANDIQIQPGDHVIVAQARQVFVVGQVKNPMALELPADGKVTISQAITLAGGFTPTANRGGVILIRGSERRKLDVGKLYAKDGQLENDICLQYGDVVFIPESFW